MAVFLSEEWRGEVEKRLKEDSIPEKLNYLSASMNCIFNDCPDGGVNYLFASFDSGNLLNVAVGTGDGPKAEFVISGDYKILTQILCAKISAQNAFVGGRIKFKGSMVRALKLASTVDRLSKIISAIKTEY